jgi:formylmethanofuran dehydrogenase subunit E
MKMSNIVTIAIITISATLLTGCEDGLQKELTDCQLTNTKLQSDMETQQMAIAKRDTSMMNSVKMISEIMIENEKLRHEILKLRKSVEAKPKRKKSTLTEKEKQDGLRELFELQRISAEKMKKEAEAEANKK